MPGELVPTPMTFHEEWFSEASQAVIVEAVEAVRPLRGQIVEIGCWEGRSTIALAKAAYPETVCAVDTWQGSKGEVSERIAARRDVYTIFMDNVKELTAGNVAPFRMTWQEWFALNDEPIKFLHIDALHDYDDVKANIETALQFIVPGGIICGDDVGFEPVRTAVLDVLEPYASVITKATEWLWECP